MAEILFLVHRIPYPPNKGDKIRSWPFFEYLARKHTVHLGFFVDDKADLEHIPRLAGMAKSICYHYISPLLQRVRSISGFIKGTPLTLAAYPSAKMAPYVQKHVASGHIDAVFLFSAAMGKFVHVNCSVPVLTDLVDVDSAKWASYAEKEKWPLSAVYRREAKLLGQFERDLVARTARSFLVSEQEADLLRNREPALAEKIISLRNGVNISQFNPVDYKAGAVGNTVIFTGAMNYPPNIEAAEWFCDHVWPAVLAEIPNAKFRIAGGPRTSRLDRLSVRKGVEVAGYVDNMAAEIAKATIAVAPLQTARGIQNKVLEAMAMAKPVVATSLANEGIEAVHAKDIFVANAPDDFAHGVISLLRDKPGATAMGANARSFVTSGFSWQNTCQALERHIHEVIAP